MLTEDEILKILNDWNYWDKDFEDFFIRPDYKEKFDNIRDSGEILVLTGIRRSGKSTLLKQEMRLLSERYSREQFLYVNFEDSRFIGELDAKLLERILDVYRKAVNPDKETILFFDEIQNIEGWERFVRTMYDLKKAHIYITGSSSKMLSRELATAIAGRYIEVRVFPLTFREYLIFNLISIGRRMDIIDQETHIRRCFDSYLLHGGFPRIALSDNPVFIKEELINYFNTILLKDIVARYGLKTSENLKRAAHYLFSNDTNLANLNLIRKALGISYESAGNFVDYFKEIFLVNEVKSFSYSLKKQFRSSHKYYSIDTGLVNMNSFKFSEDKGALLENVVLNHLVRKSLEVFYYRTARSECDFIVKDGRQVRAAIQVCYAMDSNNSRREIKGLFEAMELFNLEEGLILTYNQEDEYGKNGRKIRVVPLWKWLLDSF